MRPHGRTTEQLRPITFETGYLRQTPGSVLTRCGLTTVLCTCTIEPAVPPFLVGTGKGWLTAEYGMLPASTLSRKARDKGGKVDGRTVEIQRLIGRSLRAITDLSKLGERTLWIDCDVLEADGGTRTTAINGAFVALVLALQAKKAEIGPPSKVLSDSVAAISVGLLEEEPRLDLEYVEDRDADVDMNLVMTGSGKFIEVQGTGEEATFTHDQLNRLLELGKAGIRSITEMQKQTLGANWPF
jgi:ribonuclease PH